MTDEPETEAPDEPDKSGKPSRTFHIKGKEKPEEGIERIAAGRADKVIEALSSINEADDFTKTVHGVRKDLKKQRSVLRMVRSELGKKQYRKQNRLYRDAARKLSGSRDAQVKVETLDSLIEGDDRVRQAAVKWRQVLVEERTAELEKAKADESGWAGEAAAKVNAGRTLIDEWSLDLGSAELIEEGLTESYRRGRKAMKRAIKDQAPENLHEWRKRAKDLWYQLRIVKKAWPDLLGEMADEAHELTDLLGDHHDFVVLAEDLAGRDLPDADLETLKSAIKESQKELAEDAFELGSRVYAEKPKDFERRVKRYWKVWRSE